MYYGPLRLRPRITGKITTVFQTASIIGVLLEVSFAWELLMVMMGFTILSWADYTYKWMTQLGDDGE